MSSMPPPNDTPDHHDHDHAGTRAYARGQPASAESEPSPAEDDRSHVRHVDDPAAAEVEPQPVRSAHPKAFAQNHAAAVRLSPLDTSSVLLLPHRGTAASTSTWTETQPLHPHPHPHPGSAGLSLQTDLDRPTQAGAARADGDGNTPTIQYDTSPPVERVASIHAVTSPIHLPPATSSLRSNLSTTSLTSSLSFGSNSALPSPYLATMADLTPLPSPVVGGSSEFPWRKRRIETSARSRGSSLGEHTPRQPTSQPTSPESPSRRRKNYGSLMQEAAIANAAGLLGGQENGRATSKTHSRTRSVSDFTPEHLTNVRLRHVTFGEVDVGAREAAEYHMQREAYLATQRGLTSTAASTSNQPSEHLPTPPPSSSSAAGSDEADEEPPHLEDGTPSEFLAIHCGIHNKRRKFRPLRQLGQGTFSTVMLATRERITAHPTPEIEEYLDPAKLVAVKIVEHGPAGGADEERIETSLKREVEMLKSVSHPSLIHLKACEYLPSRAFLVLSYCQGGDLFDFASQQRPLLTPSLVRRMFAELVSAVRYLHVNGIVHRDIKLENVLVNLPSSALQSLPDPLVHPTPIVTLTDLGLSRRIPEPPDPPFLTTRCGSEDYAAPEILLGQPYDGRLTDGWALGVLLYALMEGRLPFDAPPGKPDRSRNTHRIARCDWIWCRFGDDDGDWDFARGRDWEGARPCVEGLLKKVRMGRKGLDFIEGLEWVKGGICVDGGLRVRGEEEDWPNLE